MPIGDRHSTSAPEGTPTALSAAGMVGLSGLRAGAPVGLLIFGLTALGGHYAVIDRFVHGLTRREAFRPSLPAVASDIFIVRAGAPRGKMKSGSVVIASADREGR